LAWFNLNEMKNYLLTLICAIIAIGCATLDKSSIKNLDQQTFQPSSLQVDCDLYDMRIDLILQSEGDDDSTGLCTEVAYHSVGFKLGNGLFIDLNGNISLLITDLFEIHRHDDFTIHKQSTGFLNRSVEVYSKNKQSFTTEWTGLFTRTTQCLITEHASIISIEQPILAKRSIEHNEGNLTYRSGLFKTRVFQQRHGYYIKSLFGKIEYTLEDNVLYLGRRYIIKNLDDTIEIFEQGLFNSEHLLFTLIRSENAIYVYDRNYGGLSITRGNNHLTVRVNRTYECIFTMLTI